MAEFLCMQKAKCLSLLLNASFLFIISCLATHLCTSSNSGFLNQRRRSNSIANYYQIFEDEVGCKGLHQLHDNKARCSYVKSHAGCQPSGYISYLQIFYCTFSPVLGYAVLVLWLLLLFYLLGDTAANYFCSSLEDLSRILKLSPTIAGVTLLSLGNGAPDLFASLISFMGDDNQDVGLNSILGGAFFVSSTVVGIISISVCHSGRLISKFSFVRDVLFLLLSLSCLLVIIIIGKINLWGAIAFLSLYIIYVLLVSTSQECNKQVSGGQAAFDDSPILPVTKSFVGDKAEVSCELGVPLLGFVVDDRPFSINQDNLQVGEQNGRTTRCFNNEFSSSSSSVKLLYFLELPLSLPRRLTIPVVSEEKWSKPYAVMSVTIAPLLLAVIWDPDGLRPSPFIYAIGVSVALICGILAFFTTEKSNPPRKCLFPWLAGGFLMSIIWTYILAQELVSLVVSLGLILGISPSILGLTVLAWGNSLGDLVTNLTIAKNGGPDGAQVAMSGCYAGPMFNTLVGLGLPLSISAWRVYPSCYLIPGDPFVYETMGFLMGGLLWALVILPKKNMRLSRFLGLGLLAIYLCFLSLKMARTVGVVQFDAFNSHFKQNGS